MPPANKYPCPNCGAALELRGARAFAPAECPTCRATIRARTDFAGYKLGEPLARSGLAMLFRATDPVTGVEFALKLIRPPFGTEPEDLGRFVAGTRTAATIDHPHCARVFGAGVEEGLAWVAMELLTGGTLAGRLAGVGRLSEAETLKLGLQAASALAAAQAAGLTHHDLEPNTFVFDEAATLKITDFGQAVLYERLSNEAGIVWGRPSLVAPERFARADEDALTDIYALGATLFCALTGTLPYDGEAHGQILFARMGNEPIRIENHVCSIQPTTAAVLNRMLAASRARRFHSWQEVIEQLTCAHGELTGRTAPPTPAPHPVQAPAPRIAPPAFPAKPALPPSAREPVADRTRAGGWFALAMVAAIVGLPGFVGWKHWFAPGPALATTSSPPASMAGSPPPFAATAGRPDQSTPAQKQESEGMTWTSWHMAKIESPKKPGLVIAAPPDTSKPGVLKMRGNSSGVDGAHDECVFFFREFSGDWTLIARIADHDGAAGLMAREGAGSERPVLAIWIGLDGKMTTALRPKPAGKVQISRPAGAEKATWLKLTRSGRILEAWHSVDDHSWKPVAKLESVTLPRKVPAGFVVWSGDAEHFASATFDAATLNPGK